MPRATIKPPQPPTTGSGVRPPQREPRCPNCGTWLSTRYSAGQPHRCDPEDVLDRQQERRDAGRIALMPSGVQAEQLRLAMATALDGPTLTGRLEPGWTPPAVAVQPAAQRQHEPAAGQAPKTPVHALKTVGWPYAAPARQSAPAPALSPAMAFCLGWVAGAASGLFVAGMVVLWWLSSASS